MAMLLSKQNPTHYSRAPSAARASGHGNAPRGTRRASSQHRRRHPSPAAQSDATTHTPNTRRSRSGRAAYSSHHRDSTSRTTHAPRRSPHGTDGRAQTTALHRSVATNNPFLEALREEHSGDGGNRDGGLARPRSHSCAVASANPPTATLSSSMSSSAVARRKPTAAPLDLRGRQQELVRRGRSGSGSSVGDVNSNPFAVAPQPLNHPTAGAAQNSAPPPGPAQSATTAGTTTIPSFSNTTSEPAHAADDSAATNGSRYNPFL